MTEGNPSPDKMSDELKQRLFSYGITPPLSSWDDISAELAEQQAHQVLRERVNALEVAPPNEAWDAIASLITVQPATKTSPARFRRITKMAAAVAGIVLLGSIYLLVNNQEKDLKLTGSNNIPGVKNLSRQSVPKVQPPQKPVLAQLAPSIPKFSSLYSALKTKKKLVPGTKRYLYKSIITEKKELEVPEVIIAAKPIRNENGEIIQDSRLISKSNDQYVSVTSPNGQQTKISSKFVNLLFYLNGDDSGENEGVFHKAFLESLIWKSRFQSWRNTISQTAFIPSSTNFMDILEMKDLILQQKDIN